MRMTIPRLGGIRGLALALAVLLFPAAGQAQGQGGQPAQTLFRPVAVVNDAAITGFDLAQRAQILVATGFPAASPDALRAEALDRLIEDRLQMQEAKRLGLTASPEAIEEALAELAQGAGLAPDEMLAQLAARGVTRQAVEDAVTADLLWRQVVRTRFARRVEPGEAEIDAEIARMQARASVAYRLAEIGLPATDAGRSEAETRALAERLYRDLSGGGDFAAAVRRYSRAPSAARGGELGWVTSASLPAEVAEQLAAVEPGGVTPPLPVPGGMSIIKVLERRTQEAGAIDPQDPELRERVRRQLTNQQAARLAEGLLQDLRRDALIEFR